MVFLLSIDRDPKSWAGSANDLCRYINLELLVEESSILDEKGFKRFGH